MKKIFLLTLMAGVISVSLASCNNKSAKTIISVDGMSFDQQKELAIQTGSNLFRQKMEAGEDLSNGPCLAEEIIAGWSADIVHFPRTPQDDQAENQCKEYRTGKTKHFIELSTSGDLIRAK